IKQAEAAKASGAGITGIASGFADLDRLLSGFQRSDLIILGARPSMGKTSLLLNIAHWVAGKQLRNEAHGAPVAVFSLEMSAEQLTQRMLAAEAGVASQRISSGQFSDADFDDMVGSADKLQSLPLYIDDTPGLSITSLRARARQLKRKHGIGLIIVDYLQLLTAPIRGDYNRVQEISLISQGLKHVARELDVPVIAASQLSRQVDSRDNKRPQLSDLRESGSIEQDADVVCFLFREDYYLSRVVGAGDDTGSEMDCRKLAEAQDRLDAVRGVTELLVSKNRKGPIGTIKLLFDGGTTTFRDYASRGSR
ncbi:replicative DNA helicase, partial [Filomicrobium sp.]